MTIINPCRECGDKGRLQDFGSFLFVKCKCGLRSSSMPRADLAVDAWNVANPVDTEHPRSAKVDYIGFLKWCERARNREVHISTSERTKDGMWELTFIWPDHATDPHRS